MPRLINSLLEDESFHVDAESIPYIARDIINMNYWNTCDYLLGYKNNKRITLQTPTTGMKLIGLTLKEFYRFLINKKKDSTKLKSEINKYLKKQSGTLKNLKFFTQEFRRNDSQFFYKNGVPTWFDCTSRATYAWRYVAQNGYIDFNNKCVLSDGEKVIEFIRDDSSYPNPQDLVTLFAHGENQVKKEIHSQKDVQWTVGEWVSFLGVNVLKSRMWVFDKISHIKTDPFKKNEKKLLKKGELTGVNESLYGLFTCASFKKTNVSDASGASGAISASRASNASHASHASSASDASYASNASRVSDASSASRANCQSWYDSPKSIGVVDGLSHPPVFRQNIYAIAGHWKIDKEIVKTAQLGWFDPFMRHGESPLYAKREGINYLGIEINKKSMETFILPFIKTAIDQYKGNKAKVEILLGDSRTFLSQYSDRFDLCYTSPPYFNFEDNGFFCQDIPECETYDEYHNKITIPVFKNVYKYLTRNGILALQVEKNEKYKKKWIEVIKSIGFKFNGSRTTGQEENKYSTFSRRDQNLLIFLK